MRRAELSGLHRPGPSGGGGDHRHRRCFERTGDPRFSSSSTPKRICGDLARKRSTHGLVYVACSLSVVMYGVVVHVELRPRRRFEFDCVLRRFCELTPPFRREQPDSLRRIRQFIDRLFDRVGHHVRVFCSTFWHGTTPCAARSRASSCGRCPGGCGAARATRGYLVDAAGPWRSFSASAPP